MEKLLPREDTIFPEKIKSFNILLKMYKTDTKCVRKACQGSKRLNEVKNLPESKVKDFGLSPLPMHNPYSETFLGIKFVFVDRFSKCLWHNLGQKDY